MAKYGPASVFLLVDGYDFTASKVKSLRTKVTALQTESHGMGDEWEEHSPVGVSRAEIVQEGAFFDTATGRSHAALSGSVPSSPQATPRVVCFGFAGQTIGEPFTGIEGAYNHEYDVLAERGDLTKANTAYTVSGQKNEGQILQEIPPTTKIVSSSVASPSVITTVKAHGITNGETVLIAGHVGSVPTINGLRVATVITATTFSIPVAVTVAGAGGTVTMKKIVDWDTESTPADYTLDKTQRAVPITSSSVASPTVITTPILHGLTTGDVILISGHSGSTPSINDEYTVTVLTTTTFTIPENVTVGGTGGAFVRADSSNGGVGYLQVTALTGFTGFVGTIRDSADDITYADLVSFTDNVSAPFAERVTVAGQVDRYLAFDGDVTGTGSITVFCGFSRN